MLTLGIRYLTGCSVASQVDNRKAVEWPPHPARVFMALAAAHFETGEDDAERSALEWLESLPTAAPHIYAPEHVERSVVTHYVPVNDKAGPSKAPLQSAAGLMRTRQPRVFPRAWLLEDVVFLFWPDAEPDGHFAALARLCGKVTRIGHSASLVQVWASQTAPDKTMNWFPNEKSSTRLRVAREGVMRYLDQRFKRREVDEFFELKAASLDSSDKKKQKAAKVLLQEKFGNQVPVRLRPEISLTCGYTQPKDEKQIPALGTVFDPHLLVFSLRRADGPYRHLDVAATLQLTARVRAALLQHLGTSIPEILSGHQGESRSERAHVAFLALPFVGHEHAHGGILGMAVAVPKDISPRERQRLFEALAAIRREGVKLGPLGRWELRTSDEVASIVTLQERAWTAAAGGARQWATVTPYVYDRHPKAKDKAAYQRELSDAVRTSWERVRQSSDVSVEVVITPVSPHLGTPPAHEFPRLTRKDGTECRHTHAILIFDRPVVGPVLLGAGRYRGYGLCKPLGG